jgi:hypothetical protein
MRRLKRVEQFDDFAAKAVDVLRAFDIGLMILLQRRPVQALLFAIEAAVLQALPD